MLFSGLLLAGVLNGEDEPEAPTATASAQAAWEVNTLGAVRGEMEAAPSDAGAAVERATPMGSAPYDASHRASVDPLDESAVANGASFSCGSKRYCTQMNSCAEANFHYRQCGLSRLDGDSDGTPCEDLCG